MTQFHKQVFQKMNLDVDVRYLKPGEYRTLVNGIPINGIIENPNDFNINNIVGNELVAYSLPTGVNTVIGYLEDKAGDRAFIFTHNDTDPADNSIYQYSNGTITLVFRSALLAFTSSQFVDADIAGDILVFTQNTSDIFKINVVKAIAGVTYTPTIDEITLIKRPPQLALEVATVTSIFPANNYLHHFQFYYRYIYEDDDTSVFSAISKSISVSSTTTDNVINVTIPAAETIPATVKQIDYAVRVDESNELVIYRNDFPVGGVLASRTNEFSNDIYKETIPDSVSVKWNDSVPRTAKSLRIFRNRLSLFNNLEGYEYSPNPLDIIASYEHAVSFTSGNPYYKEGARYDFGIMFFDRAGRHAGVQTGITATASLGSRVIIPDDRKNTAAFPYIVNVDLTGILLADIPTWATHFSVVRTNCSIPFFLQALTRDISYYTKDDAGEYVYTDTYASTETGLAIDISGLTAIELGYTFQKGDRIKLYSLAPLTVGVFDLEIKEQSGKFIYTGLTDLGLLTGTPGLIFEIYTPDVTGQNLFFEVGNKYVINNAGTGSRALSVTTVYPDGDSTIIRNIFEAMNSFDKYFEKWIHRTGRAIALNTVGSKELRKSNYLRYSQVYDRFGINGLNTFEALDEYALPIENGPGTMLVEDGHVLIAIHERATGSIYMGEGFVNTTDGAQFLSKTDNVIGDDRTYIASQGSTVPKSIAVKDGAVYFLDIIGGHIIRRSQDGLTRISDYGVRGFVAEVCEWYRVYIDFYDICAGWDPQYECYVIAFQNTSGPPVRHNQVTLYFHEKTNSWVAASQFQPRFLGVYQNRQLSFVAGALWIQSIHDNYNNWFGVQYIRQLDWEVGQDSLEKIWESIEVDVESIYDSDGTNEDIVVLWDKNPLWTDGAIQTKINYHDFVLRGSAYRSAFFRWMNDISFASQNESKYKSPHSVRGQSAYFTIVNNSTDRNPMKSITVGYRPSMNTNP